MKRFLWIVAAVMLWLPAGATEGLESLRLEAERGSIEAMNLIGYLLLSGDEDTPRDPAAGLSWITRAATLGDVKAASNLGWLLIDGGLVEQNLPEGARWLRRAADKGLPVALSLLGDLYLEGRGVEKDSIEAARLYRDAFEGGLADAGYKLYALNASRYAEMPADQLVEEGKYYYLRLAPSEGVKLFYLAADKGSSDALALLGDAYTRAIGVPYDHDLSLRYYVEAAVAGNPSAQFVVGELLEIFPDALKGHPEWSDVSDDPFLWYAKAAEAGVNDADTATKRLLF